MIEEKIYFCPCCGNGFDEPKKFVTPCCGAQVNQDGFICNECGESYEEDMEIPECPHCGNIGSTSIQPDFWECLTKDIEWWNSRAE